MRELMRVLDVCGKATLAILLCGGEKRTQTSDVKRASEMARDWD